MAAIGTATIKVDPDLARLTTVMRVLSKHLTACADELDADNTVDRKPHVIRSWKNGVVTETEVPS